MWWGWRMSEDNGVLLTAAQRGDQSAWDILVDRYNGLLWSIVRSYGLDTATSGDAVQNAWLRLVENLDRITDPERLGSWLATTARRECLQIIRRGSRERPVATSEWLTELPDGAAAPDTRLLLDERDAALWQAVGELGARCQRLLRVLMASPPPTYAEVAAALDMPTGSIGPARQRCLDQLRRLALADGVLGPAGRSGDEA